ncbi:MAG: hypothetical protein QOG35_2725 [Solirubrobacteraceae bacterium]|nr:hypothetical protein [Solirubrobacteraceae bacterium]
MIRRMWAPAPQRPGRASAAAIVAALALAAGASAATSPRPVVFRDPVDAAARAPDLVRVQLGVASEGRVRAALTLASPWVARDLLASKGPPGSLCLRLWTRTAPGGTPPDYLACMTSQADGETMRGSVFQNRAGQRPLRVADAEVGRTSARTGTLRFALAAIGDPAAIHFAAEATKPGCARVSCVDTAPNAPQVATLTLKESAR